jgi:EF hand
MDLNADGTLDGDELAVSQGAVSATARGRMERQFRAADTNGDARVDAAEQAAEGQAAALRAVSEDEAQLLRSLVRLDADGDGALTQKEVEAALSAKASDT